MSSFDPPPDAGPFESLTVGRVMTWWIALTSLGGLATGALAERRLSGPEMLLYSVLASAFALCVAAAILRLALRRPLRDIVSNSKWTVVCAVSVVAFLIGAWLGAQLSTTP